MTLRTPSRGDYFMRLRSNRPSPPLPVLSNTVFRRGVQYCVHHLGERGLLQLPGVQDQVLHALLPHLAPGHDVRAGEEEYDAGGGREREADSPVRLEVLPGVLSDRREDAGLQFHEVPQSEVPGHDKLLLPLRAQADDRGSLQSLRGQEPVRGQLRRARSTERDGAEGARGAHEEVGSKGERVALPAVPEHGPEGRRDPHQLQQHVLLVQPVQADLLPQLQAEAEGVPGALALRENRRLPEFEHLDVRVALNFEKEKVMSHLLIKSSPVFNGQDELKLEEGKTRRG